MLNRINFYAVFSITLPLTAKPEEAFDQIALISGLFGKSILTNLMPYSVFGAV